MERVARPAFSFGLRATRSCQCSRSESTRKSSERPIFLRNTFRLESSQSQSASPMGASLASGWLKPPWGPRKNTLPPTMPTSGRWPRTFSGVLGLVPADDGDAAGHELPEVVSGGAQHPHLRRAETRVVFGHGHAACADVAADQDPALGHGVGGAVARVAVDDDLGAGVQPAHVVGHRPEDFDHGVGKPHGPHPLPGVPGDPDGDRLLPGAPEPAADAVLAEGLDLQLAVTLCNGLLHLLLENAGRTRSSPRLPEMT